MIIHTSVSGKLRRNKMPSIYQPAEDSYLMSEHLEKIIPNLLSENSELKFLEIGVGSGINLKTVLKSGVKKENILGTDINPESVEHCKGLGFDCVFSDLFDNVEGKFDLIIFNPPYLPLDENEPSDSRRATTGGKKGNEIIIRFLEQAKNHLGPQGRIFLITSSLSESIDFSKFGYESVKVGEMKLFFEKLILWDLR